MNQIDNWTLSDLQNELDRRKLRLHLEYEPEHDIYIATIATSGNLSVSRSGLRVSTAIATALDATPTQIVSGPCHLCGERVSATKHHACNRVGEVLR
jgi:hypothetical protein